MEDMINDVAMSVASQRVFKAWCEAPEQGSAQVLTKTFWPSSQGMGVKLPPKMLRCLEAFCTFYNTKTSHRQLQWPHSLCRVAVRGTFHGGAWYDLQVTTIQAACLLLFDG